MINIQKGLSAGHYRGNFVTRFRANRRTYALLQFQPTALLQRFLKVPDVSFYQDKNTTPQGIDFRRMREAGAVGVIIRAGQGTWVDEDFDTNWRNAKAEGLPRGSYWYYDPRVAPKEQADRWVAQFGWDLPELDLWLDAEYPDSWGGPWAGWTYLYDFLERLKVNLPATQKTIYTGYYWWFEHVWSKTTAAQLAYFKQYPLNIAWYASEPTIVKLPQPWTEARWWQYTSSGDGLLYGAESLEIDLNYFNGDLDLYKQTFGLGTTPPPSGGSMKYGTITAGTLNIRNSLPGGSYQDIGDLPQGAEVVSDAQQVAGTVTWWHLKDATLNGAPVVTSDGRKVSERTDCWASGNYIAEHEPPVVTQEALLDITVTDPVTGKRYGGTGIRLPELP